MSTQVFLSRCRFGYTFSIDAGPKRFVAPGRAGFSACLMLDSLVAMHPATDAERAQLTLIERDLHGDLLEVEQMHRDRELAMLFAA